MHNIPTMRRNCIVPQLRNAVSSAGSSVKRRRSRPVISMITGAAALFVVQSLSSPAPTTTTARSKAAVVFPTSTEESKINSRNEYNNNNNNKFLSSYLDEEFDVVDFDDESEVDIKSFVNSFQQLQKSTGSEILQSDLQQLVDLGPNQFLDKQGETELEKLAMSSITEQLPQAAVRQAYIQQQKKKKVTEGTTGTKPTKKWNDLNFSKSRVTAEQELQLARIIQTGSALFNVKQNLEVQLERSITKQEWADAVGLTPKLLRQTVSAYRKAKHNLVTANLGLVHAVVKQQYKPGSGISKEELIQEGTLGLLRAAELFDPSRGLRFSTYAVVWIKGRLSNTHVPELVKVPSREKTKWNKICQAQKDITMMNGGTGVATVEEIAATTGLTVVEIIETQRKMNQASKLVSLDYERKVQSRSGGDTSNFELVDKNLCNNDDTELAERTQLQADLIAAMARNLDAREARLLRLRYGLSDGKSRSLQECADAMGLSYTRVYQLSKRCLKKLREAAEAESLEEYLLTIA